MLEIQVITYTIRSMESVSSTTVALNSTPQKAGGAVSSLEKLNTSTQLREERQFNAQPEKSAATPARQPVELPRSETKTTEEPLNAQLTARQEKRKKEIDEAEQQRQEKLEAARKEREERLRREKAEREAERKAIIQAQRKDDLNGKLDEIRSRMLLNLNDLAEQKRASDDLIALRKAWDRQIDLFA